MPHFHHSVYTKLLYRREHVLPSAVREKLHPVVDLDDPEYGLRHYMIELSIFGGLCLWL